MEFKVFMQAAEKQIDNLKTEGELREWLKNYARTIPEEGREEFLQKFEKPESHTHEDKLEDFAKWCSLIEEGKLSFFCQGYESYGESLWDSDYIYEYEDTEGIGGRLEEFCELAEQCVYDRDYKTASAIYEGVMGLIFWAEDIDGGDPVELDIKELVSEHLAKLDLKRMAALTLYSVYQDSKAEERAGRIYSFFANSLFRDIKLEDMLSAGMEPLVQTEEFMESWIAYLRGKDHSYTSELLRDAIVFHKGTEGLLEEAKRCANQHPKLYIEVLEAFYNSKSWDKLYEESKEALHLMNKDMEIRAEIARLTAAGARELGNDKEEGKAYFEAFYSEQSVANYLRLITCSGVEKEQIDRAKERMDEVWQKQKGGAVKPPRYYLDNLQGIAAYIPEKYDMLNFSFFNGNFEAVLKECRKQKNFLGWSGGYINTGISLLLALLYQGTELRPAMSAITGEIRHDLEYKEQYGEPFFDEILGRWKSTVDLDEKIKEEILEYLRNVTDGRVAAVVSGKHRGSYYKAALLGAALGEVEESLGSSQGKEKRIQKYLEAFPRHRAFKEEMQGYEG